MRSVLVLAAVAALASWSGSAEAFGKKNKGCSGYSNCCGYASDYCGCSYGGGSGHGCSGYVGHGCSYGGGYGCSSGYVGHGCSNWGYGCSNNGCSYNNDCCGKHKRSRKCCR